MCTVNPLGTSFLSFHALVLCYSTQCNLVSGVCHGAEVAYLFKGFYIDEAKLSPDTDYMKTVSRMVKLWTNFAKTG
jgi:carboxylesterase type B